MKMLVKPVIIQLKDSGITGSFLNAANQVIHTYGILPEIGLSKPMNGIVSVHRGAVTCF